MWEPVIGIPQLILSTHIPRLPPVYWSTPPMPACLFAARTLATGKIVNTGTGSPTQGNYRIELQDAAGRKWKTGNIEGFPRKRLLAWDLLYRALEKLLGNRNRRVLF